MKLPLHPASVATAASTIVDPNRAASISGDGDCAVPPSRSGASRRAGSALRRRLALLLSVAACCVAGSAWAGPAYRFIDLGAASGTNTYGTDLNEAGQVVGYSRATNDFHNTQAITWNGSVATPLGGLGGSSGAAYGINNAGQIVGSATKAAGGALATLWNRSTAPTPLGGLGGPDAGGTAFAINNAGHIVGVSRSPQSGESHATLWTGSAVIDIDLYGPEAPTSSTAIDINDVGEVTGTISQTSYFPYFLPQVFVYRQNGASGILGALGADTSGASAINNRGQIVGVSDTLPLPPDWDINQHAALWNSRTTSVPLDLGTLGGNDAYASDINNAGLIVGNSGTAQGSSHATLWNGSAIIDLNSFLDAATLAEGWILSLADGINERGWITGTAINQRTNETHAYLLVTVVAEPEVYALMLAGLGVVMLAARRRHDRRGVHD